MHRVPTATMGFKHRDADLSQVKAGLETPNFLLKIIPHVDCTPRICELVEYHLENITIKGAWAGPAALVQLSPHAWTRGRAAGSRDCVREPHPGRSDAPALAKSCTIICNNQSDVHSATTREVWSPEGSFKALCKGQRGE